LLLTHQIAQCYDPEDYIVQECPNLGSPASAVRPSPYFKLCLYYKHSTIIRRLCVPIIMIATRSDCGPAQAVVFCLKKNWTFLTFCIYLKSYSLSYLSHFSGLFFSSVIFHWSLCNI